MIKNFFTFETFMYVPLLMRNLKTDFNSAVTAGDLSFLFYSSLFKKKLSDG